jgi:galactokinase
MVESNVPLATLHEQVVARFTARFGQPPHWVAAAPGRVNVIGEHTDYNDGFVLPMAIERFCVIAAAPAPAGSRGITWFDEIANAAVEIPLDAPITKGSPSWANYIRGVIAGFVEQGKAPPALQVYSLSTVPLGGGLSSSAALEVATATLMEAVRGEKLDPVAKALLCQKAEHQYAGVPCGIMDQFASALGREGHLLLLDCRSRETQAVSMSDASVSVLIINTNVKHELTGGGYAQRRAQCETAARTLGLPSLRSATQPVLDAARGKLDEVVYRRARHVIGEIDRTVKAVAEIRAGRWEAAGQHMYASHASLRDDYDVSCEELDVVVDIGRSIGMAGGVYGCRMTGGGFGGCAVALVQTSKVAEIAARIASEYEARTKIKPTLFLSRPASGAVIL